MIMGIYMLLEALSLVLILHSFYDCKFRLDWPTCVFLASDILGLLIINLVRLPNQYTVLMYIIVFLYCVKEFGYDRNALIINCTLSALFMTISQFFIAVVGNLILSNNLPDVIVYLSTNVILFVVSICLYKWNRGYKISGYILNKSILIRIALIFDVILLIGCLLLAKKQNMFLVIKNLIILGSCLIIICLAIDLGRNMLKNKQLEAENKMQALYSESFESLITEIRMKQHEFDNHINAILGLQHTCKNFMELTEKQKEYAGDVICENKYNKLLNTGNYAVVGFLYNQFTHMEAEGLIITYKVAAKQIECRAPVYVLVEILGNLLDNAKDELKRIGKKRLYVAILETPDEVILEVGNESEQIPFEQAESFFQKGKSSKGSARGLGLYHVKKICEQYKMDIICDNKVIENRNFFSIQIKAKRKHGRQ